jgi:hypothetical protein
MTPEALNGNCAKIRANFHKPHRLSQGCGNLGEDSDRDSRPGGMLKVAVALVLLFALAAALADLGRGRRPVLFA